MFPPWVMVPMGAVHFLAVELGLQALSGREPLVFSSWAVAACMAESAVSPWAAVLVVGIWMPVAAWEIARKVRAPGEETDYTTYSKVLGARRAASLPAFFVLVSGAALGAVAWRA